MPVGGVGGSAVVGPDYHKYGGQQALPVLSNGPGGGGDDGDNGERADALEMTVSSGFRPQNTIGDDHS